MATSASASAEVLCLQSKKECHSPPEIAAPCAARDDEIPEAKRTRTEAGRKAAAKPRKKDALSHKQPCAAPDETTPSAGFADMRSFVTQHFGNAGRGVTVTDAYVSACVSRMSEILTNSRRRAEANGRVNPQACDV